jgi:hypothetical protein
MNLYVARGFAFQDPNMAACTAAAARSMLNFIALRQTGGDGFAWSVTNWNSVRDRILAWERAHDTLPGGTGSDPHGWRNALNYFGWGEGALDAGYRVYDDRAYGTYENAVRDAIRQLVRTKKPVGLLAWRGGHAQMMTGYYGLHGNPFARDSTGKYLNAFTVTGFYITDPLRKSGIVNRGVRWSTLKSSIDYTIRFQRYYERDSTQDDPYTPGFIPARDEWYKKFVLILPFR